jgi:tetratricopeptide (TPR) repeat protein
MYRRALALRPRNYRIAGFLSEAYYWSPGQRDLGIETFRRAIDLAEGVGPVNDRDPTLLSDLASYYARIGDLVRSEEFLAKAVALEAAEWPILFRIADTFEQLGKRESALEWVGKALDQGAPLETMDNYPGLRELRADPRYKEILDDSRTGV